jgi:hypothetical protein
MIGMQYKIILPKDYDMGIIRDRVEQNGSKMDGFRGLIFKAYLITEKGRQDNLSNSYAPLYLWEDPAGMNRFLFEGYYDNILESFGWQHISIGVPNSMVFNEGFEKSRYVAEYQGTIQKAGTLMNTNFYTCDSFIQNVGSSAGSLMIYNPDKWGYSHFLFFHEKPKIEPSPSITLYEVLHISQ